MHTLLQLLHVFYVMSEWKVLLFGVRFEFLLLSSEGFKADAISLTDHGIVEAEWPVLLVLGDEFAIVIIRNQFLYGLPIGVERLEPLWRDGSSEIFRRVLKIVK